MKPCCCLIPGFLLGLWLSLAASTSIHALPGDGSSPPKPTASLGAVRIAANSDTVSVPVLLRHGELADGVQLTIDYEAENLQFSGFRPASNEWQAETSIVYPGGLVTLIMRRVGSAPATPPGESVAAAYVTFSLPDFAGRPPVFRLRTPLTLINRVGAQGSFFFIVRSGREPYPIPGEFLDGGEVTIYFRHGVEVGSVGITAKGQRFTLPVYLTYIDEVSNQNAEELPAFSLGIDYDELFLKFRGAEGLPPLLMSGDLSTRNLEEGSKLGNVGADLVLSTDFTGPVFHQHVADLRFEYIGGVPHQEGEEISIAVRVSLVVSPPEAGDAGEAGQDAGDGGEGAGQEAGEPGDAGPPAPMEDPDDPSSAVGLVTVLPPYFVRGNVDSSYTLDPQVGTILRQQGDLTDVIRILEFKFLAGRELGCKQAADVNGSCDVDITDAVMLLNHLFRGGPPPVAPYPQPGFENEAGCWLGCEVRMPFFQLMESPLPN